MCGGDSLSTHSRIFGFNRRWMILLAGFIFGLVFGLRAEAGIITSPLLSPEMPTAPQDLKDQRLSPLPFYKVPALWGMEITGADEAKKIVTSLTQEPVDVVVSDSAITVGGVASSIDLGLPEKEPKHISIVRLRPVPLLDRVVDRFVDDRPLDVERDSVKIFETVRVPIETLKPSPHGAHVAGTVGLNNEDFGVSPVVSITELNVFRGSKWSTIEEQERALERLMERPNPHFVVNMSHGLSSSQKVVDSLKDLLRQGTLISVATHNQGKRVSPDSTIGRLKDLVRVGAFGLTGTKTYFSNYGEVDIVAPGEAILSNGWGKLDQSGPVLQHDGRLLRAAHGTSMATPMVSGVLANLRAVLPEGRAEDLRSILFKTAIDLGYEGRDDDTGHGLLNAYKAVKVAERLFKQNLASPEAIQSALQNPAIFAFKEEMRQLVIEKNRLGPTHPHYEAVVRKIALLKQEASALEDVAYEYERRGSPLLATGIHFAAQNVQGQAIDRDTAENQKRLQQYAALQEIRLALDRKDTSIFDALANAELTVGIYEALSPRFVEDEKFFAQRVLQLERDDLLPQIAEARNEKIERIIAEVRRKQRNEDLLKIDGSLVVAPVDFQEKE